MPRKERNKRKARKNLIKGADLTKPVILPLEQIGSKDDPCFGRLNDPRHPTCQRCGDIEMCSIAMAQLNNLKRLAIEKEKNFKDIEEAQLVQPDKKEQRVEIKKRIKELLKEKAPREKIILDIHGKYVINGWTKKKIGILLDKVTNKK